MLISKHARLRRAPLSECSPAGSAAYTLSPLASTNASAASIFDDILNGTVHTAFDSYYIAVYTAASEAIPHLRGQIHSVTPGEAGYVASPHGRC